MLNKLKKLETKGFTIIEVMIVLAIAGLIILIVPLAVPALQRNSRNTAIKNDASAVAAGIGEFASNNDGAIPTTSSTYASGTVTLRNAAGAASPQVTAKVQSSDTVTFQTGSATVTGLTPGDIRVAFRAKCNAVSGTGGYTLTTSNRSTAIVYITESSGNNAPRCLDS